MIRKIHWGDLAVPLFLFCLVNAGNFDSFWVWLMFGIVGVSYLFAFTKPFDTFPFPSCLLHFLIAYSLTGLLFLIFKNLWLSAIITIILIFLWELYQKIQDFMKTAFREKITFGIQDVIFRKVDLDTILDIIFGFLGMIIFILIRR
jgi:hypothetical protein